MSKKRFFLSAFVIFSFTRGAFANYAGPLVSVQNFSDTGVAGKKSLNSSLVANAETITSPDRDAALQNTAKKGFNDLFLASSTDASNGSRLNYRAVSFVQDYVVKNDKDLEHMKSWGKPYFNLIEGVLSSYGLPREMKYLAVIESQLKSHSISWAGAVGPWQLMPVTARQLGLKVTHRYDERTNYYKSSQAAAKYLRDLYNEFGDWLLVIAAYNGGSGHIYTAMRKSHSRNFWDLQYYLPAESRNHVKKFIATHYIFEGQGGITTLTKEEATEQLSGSSMYVFHRKLSPLELKNARTVSISGKYHSSIIAKYILMDNAEFCRFNPEFDKVMASTNNTYELTLPGDKMDLFAANKYQILNESVQLLLSSASEINVPKSSASIAKKEIL